MYENKGAYGLLLGSGISRSAGVPTGWEVVLDLIQRVARLSGADTGEDPAGWYRREFSGEPNYSQLLARLAHTPEERRALLRRYFEPTEEEREQQLKTPTECHRRIAHLVRSGYVRMIVTTNFDRLLEEALDGEGVRPSVIASDDQFRGAVPYVHEQCVLVKLHGDYLDARIRNTAEELAAYSRSANSFLDRVFDEFGFVVCGWSGKYDDALRAAILRCRTRRYSWFWLARHELEDESREIAQNRRADVVNTPSADSAFTKLDDLVQSLEEEGRPHPLSVPLAVATTKRYLTSDRFRINLEDLVTQETRTVLDELASGRFRVPGGTMSFDDVQVRCRNYESLTQRLGAILAAIAYYDRSGKNTGLLTTAITRCAVRRDNQGLIALLDLQSYPALLLVYASGLAGLAGRSFKNLSAVLLKPRSSEVGGKDVQPIIAVVSSWKTMRSDVQKTLPRPNAQREHTPLSNYLQDILRAPLADYLVSDDEFEWVFDRFEYLISLVFVDQIGKEWQPWGAYSWRWSYSQEDPAEDFLREYRDGLLSAGFFQGDASRMEAAVNSHRQWLRDSIRPRQF
jgi:hypothetical protein